MLLLYNNLLDTATLTASSEATGFPANNLKNPFRTKCWKTAGTVPGTAQLVVDFGSAQTVDAIALTGYDWATAPGKLVVEFNSSDSWDAPAAVETLTWHSPTTPGGNKGSIILKMSASRTYQYARLRVVSAGGVALVSTGSNALSIADDPDLDMGIHDLTLFWRGSLPAWRPSAPTNLIRKYNATHGYRLYIAAVGNVMLVLLRNDGGTVMLSTAIPSLVNGSEHTITTVVTRETASVAGSVIFYVDGVKLGDTVAITAAAAISIDNNAIFYIGGSSIVPIDCTIKSVRVYNRALTAAEVLALHTYDTVDANNSYGSDTPFYTADFSAGADGWVATRGTVAGNVDGISDGSVSKDNCLKFYASADNDNHYVQKTVTTSTVNGNYILWKFWYYIPSGQTNVTRIGILSTVAASTLLTVVGAWTYVEIVLQRNYTSLDPRLRAYSSTSGTFIGANDPDDDRFYIADAMTICQAGAVLDLAPEGITATDWQDSSTNNLDATYPVTGSSITGLADFSLGRLFLGEYFEPERNYSYGYQEAVVDPSVISQTIAGQRHADELEHYRTFEASGQLFSQAQWVLFQEMINTVGIRKPFFVALDYDNDPEERTLYGHFTQPPSITRLYNCMFNYDFTIEEDR
jgi:hypothetical protein